MVASGQKSGNYEPIKTWNSYQAARTGGGQKWALENEKLFFVLFDSYRECPLELHVIEGGYYSGTYSVTQRVGGPTIDLFVANIHRTDNTQVISHGFVSYYATYRNTINGEMERTPQVLLDQYKAIVKHLKKGAVTIKGYTDRKYVIGPHTYPRIKSGELVMGVKGLELSDLEEKRGQDNLSQK